MNDSSAEGCEHCEAPQSDDEFRFIVGEKAMRYLRSNIGYIAQV
jgi:hypothetical protein